MDLDEVGRGGRRRRAVGVAKSGVASLTMLVGAGLLVVVIVAVAIILLMRDGD
jgi:hypothetical protein